MIIRIAGLGLKPALAASVAAPVLAATAALLSATAAQAQQVCQLSSPDGTNAGTGGATSTNTYDWACGLLANATSPAAGQPATAIGAQSNAQGIAALAVGPAATVYGAYSSSIGFDAVSGGDRNAAFGTSSIAGVRGASTGSGWAAPATTSDSATALGVGAQAGTGGGQHRATALGADAAANALNATALGSQASVSATGAVAIGQGSIANVANTVSFGAGSAQRRLVNVAAGTISSGGTDGVNTGQLYTANNNVATALGSGVSLSSGGVLSGFSLSVQGSARTSVSAALTALDTQVTANSGKLTYFNTALSGSAIALGAGSATSTANTVSFGDATTQRRLVNLASGVVTPDGTDGVNTGQLYTANSNVASAIGSGVSLSAAGVLSGFSQTVQGANRTSISDAITALDSATTAIMTGGAAGLRADNTAAAAAPVASGANSVAAGFGASATGANAVALGAGSLANADNSVSVGAAGAERRIVNVAGGTLSGGSTDAVNGAQLAATNVNVAAAQDTADTARTEAAAAQSSASAAQGTANLALANAATAQTAANAAQAAANAARGEAASAQTRADDAYALAQQAQQNGVASAQTAQLALQNAAQAQTAADTARTRADAAQTSASSAQANADLARQVAESAAGNAAAARASADEALARTQYLAVNGGGETPSATGQYAMAFGAGANASGAHSVAMGAGAVAKDGAAVSIGYGNIASGNGAVAIGDPNVATGRGAVAMGADNIATGEGAVAIGADSVANGRSAVALGLGARAQGSGAVAIGEGALATRAGQVALGSARSTYTMAGLASDASRAAQSGPTGFVTTDARGNLAASDIGPGSVFMLAQQLDDGRRDARSGVAASMAMSAAPMPSERGRTSFAANAASFRDRGAIGGSVARRLNTDMMLAFTAGVAYAGDSNTGARIGVMGEF